MNTVNLGDLTFEDEESRTWFTNLDRHVAEMVAARAAIRAFLVSLAVATRRPDMDLHPWRETHSDIRLMNFLVIRSFLRWRPTAEGDPTLLSDFAGVDTTVTLQVRARFASHCLENANGATHAEWYEALVFSALALADLSGKLANSEDTTAIRDCVWQSWKRTLEHARMDVESLKQHAPSEVLLMQPFSEEWLAGELRTVRAIAVARYDNDPEEGPRFAYWREWYRAVLDGAPLDPEMHQKIAMIPDQDLEQGHAHLAARIDEIRARFEVETAARSVENYLQRPIVAQTRTGAPSIGHNNPPPDDALPALRPEVQRLAELVQDLQKQMQASDLNLARVETNAQEIQETERKIGLWLAKQLNVSADEFFKELGKWGGRVAAAGLTAGGLWLFGLLQDLGPLLQALRALISGAAG